MTQETKDTNIAIGLESRLDSHLKQSLKATFNLDLEHESTDVLVLNGNEEKLGIEQSRQIKHFLETHPLEDSVKSVIILNAQFLTIQAQQALLKSLEEFPPYARIFLQTPNFYTMLPTIRSRIQIVRSIQDYQSEKIAVLDEVKTLSSIGDKINFSGSVGKSKEEAKDFLEQLTLDLRNQMIGNPTKITLYNLIQSLYALKLVQQNIQSKLVLENLLFKLRV